MIFDSEYRNRAMSIWESEREELKQELKLELKENLAKQSNIAKNPLVVAIAVLFSWFTQH
jgi:type III secretory pathway component EscU